MNRILTILVLAALGMTARAAPPDFDTELAAIQKDWAAANYQTPAGRPREAAFERLAARAADFTARNPGRPEALIWEGIVLSSYAGVKGGLGALGLAKEARQKLEDALALDPKALDGSAHTSLGTLYHKVPGFPLGFGSDRKAREHLEAALRLNPDGIDPNYFYGEFLYDEGNYGPARRHLEKALQAPPRPGREAADAGRRGEIRALLARLDEQQG